MENIEKCELWQGDCLELMKNIPNDSIDCNITSPPYNKSFFSKQKKTNQIWVGFEISEEYVKMANERVESQTRQFKLDI